MFYKKIILGIFLMISIFYGFIFQTNANYIGTQSLNEGNYFEGNINSNTVSGLKQTDYTYKLSPKNIFGLGHIVGFNTSKGVVEFYYIIDKTHFQFIGQVPGYNLTKLGNKFTSLSFYVNNGLYKNIYQLYKDTTDNNTWKIKEVGSVLDTSFTPLEYKDNVFIGSKKGIIGEKIICSDTTSCNNLKQSNPDYFNKLLCSINDKNEQECKAEYKGDIIYAYSLVNQTQKFVLINADTAEMENVTYEGQYNWYNYSNKYNLDYPIKLNGLFLYNINNSTPGIKYFNIVSNVNWVNDSGTGDVNQIVMFSIKSYDNSELNTDMMLNDTITNLTGALYSGNTLYDISNTKAAKYFGPGQSTVQEGGVLGIKGKDKLVLLSILSVKDEKSDAPLSFKKNIDLSINNIVLNNLMSSLGIDFVNKKLYTVLSNHKIGILDFSKYIKADYKGTYKLLGKDTIFLYRIGRENGNYFGTHCENINGEYKCMGIDNFAGNIEFNETKIALGQAINNKGVIVSPYKFIAGSVDFTQNKMYGILKNANGSSIGNANGQFVVFNNNHYLNISLLHGYGFKNINIALNHLLSDNGGLISTNNKTVFIKYGQHSVGLVKIFKDNTINNFNIGELFNGLPLSNPLLLSNKNINFDSGYIYLINNNSFSVLKYDYAKKMTYNKTYKLGKGTTTNKQYNVLISDINNMYNLKSWNGYSNIYNSDAVIMRPIINSDGNIIDINVKKGGLRGLITNTNFVPYKDNYISISLNGKKQYYVNKDKKFGYVSIMPARKIAYDKTYKLGYGVQGKEYNNLIENTKYLANVKNKSNSSYKYNSNGGMFKVNIDSNNIITKITGLKGFIKGYTTVTDLTPTVDNYNTNQAGKKLYYINGDKDFGYTTTNNAILISQGYISTGTKCSTINGCSTINNGITEGFKLSTGSIEALSGYNNGIISINNSTFIIYNNDNGNLIGKVLTITSDGKSVDITGANVGNVVYTKNGQIWNN